MTYEYKGPKCFICGKEIKPLDKCLAITGETATAYGGNFVAKAPPTEKFDQIVLHINCGHKTLPGWMDTQQELPF